MSSTERVLAVLEEAKQLFARKNNGYSTNKDLSHFSRALPVTCNQVTEIDYVWILASKQDIALAESMTALSCGKLCPEQRETLKERLLDGIVYRAILLTILEEKGILG